MVVFKACKCKKEEPHGHFFYPNPKGREEKLPFEISSIAAGEGLISKMVAMFAHEDVGSLVRQMKAVGLPAIVFSNERDLEETLAPVRDPLIRTVLHEVTTEILEDFDDATKH